MDIFICWQYQKQVTIFIVGFQDVCSQKMQLLQQVNQVGLVKTTVIPVLSDHSKIDKTKVLKTNGSLMKVESIAECSKGSILQYFWPALSDNWSWKPIFGLFESGCFRQVLLYSHGG